MEALLVEQQWSPEQIAHQLFGQLGVRISHMTIYRHVRWDQRQGGPKSLARTRQSDCDTIAAKLNQRPRKRYGFQTPTQRLQQSAGVLHLQC